MLKRYHTRYISLILLCGIVFTICAVSLLAEDETEYRIKAENVIGIGQGWKGTISFQSRVDSHGDNTRQHTDFGAMYLGFARWLDVGIRYRTVFKLVEETDWAREHRYYLDMMGRHALAHVGFSHRVRLEYNEWVDGIDDFGTLRYRISINPPYTLNAKRESLILRKYQLRPYANYEIAINSVDSGVALHSYEVGLSSLFTEAIVGNLYYMREDNNSTVEDTDLNVLGVTLRILL